MFGTSNKGAIYVPLEQHDEIRPSSEIDEAFLKTAQTIKERRSPLVKLGVVLAIVAFIAAYSLALIMGTAKVVRTDRRLGTRWIKCKFSRSVLLT